MTTQPHKKTDKTQQTRSQPRQAKSPPHCAAGSTESKVNTTTATPTPEALAIAVIFKDFEIDHTPDGWPAVKQMHLSAAAAELERQHAEIDRLTDAYGGAREDIAIWKRRALEAEEKLRAEIARLTAENEAVQDAVSDAVAAEREACAELMEQQHTWITNVAASALIRARGTP